MLRDYMMFEKPSLRKGFETLNSSGIFDYKNLFRIIYLKICD